MLRSAKKLFAADGFCLLRLCFFFRGLSVEDFNADPRFRGDDVDDSSCSIASSVFSFASTSASTVDVSCSEGFSVPDNIDIKFGSWYESNRINRGRSDVNESNSTKTI